MLSMMTGMFHAPQFQLRMTPISGSKRPARVPAPFPEDFPESLGRVCVGRPGIQPASVGGHQLEADVMVRVAHQQGGEGLRVLGGETPEERVLRRFVHLPQHSGIESADPAAYARGQEFPVLEGPRTLPVRPGSLPFVQEAVHIHRLYPRTLDHAPAKLCHGFLPGGAAAGKGRQASQK